MEAQYTLSVICLLVLIDNFIAIATEQHIVFQTM